MTRMFSNCGNIKTKRDTLREHSISITHSDSYGIDYGIKCLFFDFHREIL